MVHKSESLLYERFTIQKEFIRLLLEYMKGKWTSVCKIMMFIISRVCNIKSLLYRECVAFVIHIETNPHTKIVL